MAEFWMKLRRTLYGLYSIGYRKFGYRSVIIRPLYIRNKKYISIGERCQIYRGARIECFDCYAGERYCPSLVLGDKVIIGYNFQCLVSSNCYIGDNTLMASNVLISTENHGMNPNEIYVNQPLSSKDVFIGSNCWIGERAIILPGVTLGNNVIVGAGSIVTSSFPDNVIIAGNPARIIKKYDMNQMEWTFVH